LKINVSVKTKSKREGVEPQEDGSYIVRVNVPPIEGKANIRVAELLAEFLGHPKSKVQLVSGTKSKNKVFKIID
jgi:uncharacterized protein (TIGR00251 family)